MIGFGFSVFTQAILGLGGGFRGSALNLDFTSGNRTLDRRVTFSRTTNATLTNSAGLIANAPMNLLTFSEQFDNAAWAKSGATVTANFLVSPDGTTTADKLIEDANTGAHLIAQLTTTSAASHALTVYAKAAGRTRLILANITAGYSYGFDVSTGTTFNDTYTAGDATATIQSVGNGWYRCSIVGTATAASNNFRILLCDGGISGSYTGDGTSGILVWGAQLEAGSIATTYNPTTVKNLLGFTEHFDNAAWTKSNASISATKVDDIYGQPFAQKLVEDTATSAHRMFGPAVTPIAGTSYAFTFYAKAAERQYAYIRLNNSGGDLLSGTVDLLTGVVTQTLTGTITTVSLGNGWFRICGVGIAVTAATLTPELRVANSATYANYTGDGTSGIYIFGAQLSDSASVDPYVYQPVAAPSSVAYYGPRFDYDPVTLAPKGLLIEEQRTNLLTYSEQFDNAAWTKNNATINANTVVAPDGTITADKLVNSIASAMQYLSQGTSIANVTCSVYAKAAELSVLQLAAGVSTEQYVNFNLTTGSVGSSGTLASNISITSVGNGWYRCSVTWTTGTAGSGVFIASVPSVLSLWLPAVSGNGFSGIYIWGAQLEAGAFATSYIPTVASQVTRTADSASMIGNNFARWYTQGPGTVFADYAAVYQSAAYKTVVQLTDGSNNYVSIRSYSVSGTTMGSNNQVVTAGSTVADLNSGAATTPFALKVSLAYATNDFSSVANGGTVSTDTLGAVPVGLNAMNMLGGTFQNGSTTIKRFAYYSRKLSPVELEGITK